LEKKAKGRKAGRVKPTVFTQKKPIKVLKGGRIQRGGTSTKPAREVLSRSIYWEREKG